MHYPVRFARRPAYRRQCLRPPREIPALRDWTMVSNVPSSGQCHESFPSTGATVCTSLQSNSRVSGTTTQNQAIPCDLRPAKMPSGSTVVSQPLVAKARPSGADHVNREKGKVRRWSGLVRLSSQQRRGVLQLSGVNIMPKLDEYLRIKEAAEFLGVARNTLRNWEASGKLRVFRHPMNNYRLFKVGDLDQLLRTTEQSPAAAERHRRPKRPR